MKKVIKNKNHKKNNEVDFKFRLAFDNVKDAILWADIKTGTIIECNKVAEELFGKTRKEIIGAHFTSLHPKDNLKSAKNIFDKHSVGDKNIFELPIITKSGKKKLTSISATVFSLDNKKILQGIFHDITDQVNLREIIKNNKLLFNTLTESMPDCVKLFDRNAQPIYLNSAALKEHNLMDNEKIRNWKFIDTLIDEDKKKFFRKFNEALKGKVCTMEVHHPPGKSTNQICLLTLSPVKDQKNDINLVFGVSRDISKSKHFQERLEESERKYRILYNSMYEGFIIGEIILNKSGQVTDFRFVNVNNAWERHTAIAKEKVVGQNVKKVFPDIEGYWISKCARVVKSGKSIHSENYLKEIDKWFEVSIYKYSENQFAAIFFDITDKKKIELRKDRFIALASHELKSPITSIQLYIQILKQRLLKKGLNQESDFVLKIDKLLKRLTNLVKDLLDLSRIQQGKLLYHKKVFPAGDLINEVLEDLKLAYPDNIIEFVNDLDSQASINADKDRLRQVLINLLANAINYSDQSKKIIIKLTKRDKEVLIGVQDFGIGIDKDELMHIFDKFYRIQEKHPNKHPGLGIGLFICKEIITRHKGRIWVESKIGRGSIFNIALKLVKNESV